MRRDYDPAFVRFRRRAIRAGAAFAILQVLVVGFWWHEYEDRQADDASQAAVIATQAAALTGQVARIDDLTDRLHDAGCKSFDTLHRFFGRQGIDRPSLQRLGLTDAQIAVAAEVIQRSKDRNLAMLGDRDPTCPQAP